MFRIYPLGDSALIVQLGDKISPDTQQLVQSLSTLLNEARPDGVIEWTPTYTTVTLFYDPYIIKYDQLVELLNHYKRQLHQVQRPPASVIEVPVHYGGEQGPDLYDVAAHTGLTSEQVITLHSQPLYLIYMMGFAPGFPYLGGLPPRLATPRRSVPRTQVPAGAVGIAGQQTGIYPIDSPGGWQIIGHTPLKLYDPEQSSFLFEAGQYIQFKPVSKEEYLLIKQAVQTGSYQPVKKRYKEDI